MEQKFNIQVPIDVIDRGNGQSLIVSDCERFYNDGDVSKGEAPLYMDAYNFIQDNIEDMLRECMMDALKDDSGKFLLTIDFKKVGDDEAY